MRSDLSDDLQSHSLSESTTSRSLTLSQYTEHFCRYSYVIKPLSYLSNGVAVDVSPLDGQIFIHFLTFSKRQVKVLAKSISVAGYLGSSSLPAAANASIIGSGDSKFTVIPNSGSIGLGKE